MPVNNKIVSGGPAVSLPGHLSFTQHVLDTLRNTEDAIALINGETHKHITRKEYLYQVVSLAIGLKKLGIKKGEVVALCSENRVEMLVSALAILCCGATVTTVNAAYSEGELRHVLNISKPRLIFCSANALKSYLEKLKEFKYLQHIVQYDSKKAIAGVIPYNSLLERNVDVASYEPEDVQGANDAALILYSSGTTGLPKGVILTHLNFLYFTHLISGNEIDANKYLTVVPWFHGYGLMSTISYMLAGRTMIFLTGFNPQTYLEAIQKYKIEVLLTVPPIVLFLIKSPMVEKFDVSSVKLMWCAAAPLSRDTTEALLKRFPNCPRVLQAYGMTETSLSVTIDELGAGARYKPGSGGAPLPGYRLKVVDIESGELLGAGEQGEIRVKGPGLMKGYAGNEAATREMLDSEGYLKTGDIGFYDEDGYFFIVDRLKEIIKYKGYQVSPAEVEAVLLQHPGVAECGVVGARDEARGELATAFVRRGPAAAALSEADLVRFVADRLSPMKHLHGGVRFVSEVPKNPSGKILRRVLKQWLAQPPASKL